MKMKSFTVIMQPHVVAHYLTRRALKRFRDLPDDADTYSAVYDSVLGTMGMAAANGDLVLLAFPLWYRVPAQFTLGDNGWLNTQGVGITIEALFDWVKSFDPVIANNHDTLDYFWKELQGDVASTESETTTADGTLIIGDFTHVRHTQKGTWYVTNKMLFIREALDALSGIPEGEGSEKQRVITWIVSVYCGSEETWKGIIKVGDIAAVKEAVKNEKREK
ncbi:MAG: hypothetical protein ACYDDR_04575 [Acidithiobacillus ferrivorans]